MILHQKKAKVAANNKKDWRRQGEDRKERRERIFVGERVAHVSINSSLLLQQKYLHFLVINVSSSSNYKLMLISLSTNLITKFSSVNVNKFRSENRLGSFSETLFLSPQRLYSHKYIYCDLLSVSHHTRMFVVKTFLGL